MIKNPGHLGRLWTSDSDAGERLQLMVLRRAMARKLDRRYEQRDSRGARRTAARERGLLGSQRDKDGSRQVQSDETATDTTNEQPGMSMVANESEAEEFFDAQEHVEPLVWTSMAKNICGFFWRY